MGVLIPIVGMLLIVFIAARQQSAGSRPVVWTWRRVGAVSLGVLGALALPIGIVLVLQYR